MPCVVLKIVLYSKAKGHGGGQPKEGLAYKQFRQNILLNIAQLKILKKPLVSKIRKDAFKSCAGELS